MTDVVRSRLHRSEPTDWVQVMLTIDRPDPGALADYSRREKFRILQDSARFQRDVLQRWIQEHGLADEVARIGDPTTFNFLFVECTPHAAQELAHAPGVVNVTTETQERVPN
ncbi:MAG: hypothetical protein R3C14_36265 [Caldilineaceae bacterium]